MVHVMAPKPRQPGFPIFFNVDTSVGRGGQNSNPDDVMLVQYFLSLIGKQPSPKTPPSLAAVKPTGKIDPITIQAIEDFQRADGIQPDGRVSVAQGYRYGSHYYTIATLGFNVQDRFKMLWPNVDKMPGCPPLLKGAVRTSLAGVG
ncbi:hypothetical protein sos41_20250 [Alphaproteobacteria bacterium SO-S41]|nr:hypothetical protein sos41_20250 [Alphaproteobacteria bacterium SO-S41]